MTGPESLTIIRHAVSVYNESKTARDSNPDYIAFRKAYEIDFQSDETKRLADLMRTTLVLPGKEDQTPILESLGWQAEQTGKGLSQTMEIPEVIFVSPYVRTRQTLERLSRGWEDLRTVPTILEPRIREREHGLMPSFGDKRIFFVNHPEQRALFEAGEYDYRYPEGENIEDVKDRVESWLKDLKAQCAGKRVLAVTHHETVLVKRMLLEGFGREGFLSIDHEDKPKNCGVTTYQNKGNGLELETYNQVHF